MPKRRLEGMTQQARAKVRKQLGTLQQLTVQPATKARYDKAVDCSLHFLKQNHLGLPSQRQALAPLLCEYLERLWSEGFGRASVGGLQDFDVRLRGHLQGSWRLSKTWSVNESPIEPRLFQNTWSILWLGGRFSIIMLPSVSHCCWGTMVGFAQANSLVFQRLTSW